MAAIPESVQDKELHYAMCRATLRRTHQGKVRDTYALRDEDTMLMVATDRVSIDGFVLLALVPDKGEILTAMTVFWLDEILKDVPHHLLAFGKEIGQHVPASLEQNERILRRALVVRKLPMAPYECIVRAFLTGSGYGSYQDDGTLFGQTLPAAEDWFNGARLPRPFFTPTTKAEDGHDLPVPRSKVAARHGNCLEIKSLKIFDRAFQRAEDSGIYLADTKFEFGFVDGQPVLADEVCTPDSSQFWYIDAWQVAAKERKPPPPCDKQVIRDWGKELTFETAQGSVTGMHNLNPADPAHVALVHQLEVPAELLAETSQLYHRIFERLVGSKLVDYQLEVLNLGKHEPRAESLLSGFARK